MSPSPDIPSGLHLKKELTQIRKAARLLRDPGTTSTLKTSRSAMRTPSSSAAQNQNPLLFSHSSPNRNPRNVIAKANAKHNKVLLHNWKYQKSNQEEEEEDEEEDADSSSWIPPALDDDSLSDARNGGDSKSDACSASMIFRCRDANLVSPPTKRPIGHGARRKGKNSKRSTTSTNCLHVLSSSSRNQQKQLQVAAMINETRLLNNRPPLGVGVGLGLRKSDDSDEFTSSEDLQGASPLLLKTKPNARVRPSSSSALFKTSRKGDSAYSTPQLSASSYTRYYNNYNPSTVGSWDATTTSCNDGDDEVDDALDLPARSGCGIPCYWSKRTPKHKGVCRSCYSPSFSDTLRRKGSSILCGSQSVYPRHRRSTSSSNKRYSGSRHAQGLLPLLNSSGGGGRAGSSILTGSGCSDDELSTNFGELDMEALSRLDGKRWSSSCRSQDGLEIVAFTGEKEEESTPENSNSLSQKYKPMFFDELIGQNIVAHSLMNAVSKGRVAPVYLFQGPRGTGKTSTARIFASALNCLDNQGYKPCGYCRECTEFISGKSREFWEVDGTDKQAVDRVRYLLNSLSAGLSSSTSRYKVFVIDECHLLPTKMWLAFLKFLEDPPSRVVVIFVTTDIDNVPRTVQSRCQKYLFNKIKDVDIVARLKKISADENLDVEFDALELIALNADGSLRDAEIMLDQLSLLGKRITTSLVNELVGVVSDEKLLELLELAMSSNTAETVKRARELMDSGVDPIVLMSQLASLIMDIIAGTNNAVDPKYNQSFPGRQSLAEAELERLKHALKLLSEAEKQLRVSSERSTWFTATLLQLGSMPSPDHTQSGSSRRQSSKTTEDALSCTSKEGTASRKKSAAQYMSRKSASPASGSYNHQAEFLSMINAYASNSKTPLNRNGGDSALATSCEDNLIGNTVAGFRNSEKLDNIWEKCIERCHSKTLRQLLHAHGKLFSISENQGVLVAYVAFRDADVKTRAERFLSSITNSIEIVMRRNVEVRIILLPDGKGSLNHANDLPDIPRQADKSLRTDKEKKATSTSAIDGLSNLDLHEESHKVPRGSFSELEGKLRGVEDYSAQSIPISGSRESKQGIPIQRIESIIREQRLETAWLQAAEKGTPGSLNRFKPEKNQILPQEDIGQNNVVPVDPSTLSSQQWEDELNHELKVLKMDDGKEQEKDHPGRRADRYPMSPSLLHDGSVNKESHGYESGSGAGARARGCSALFCWNNNNNNTKRPRKGKMTRMNSVRARKSARFSLFGECVKAKKNESRFRR